MKKLIWIVLIFFAFLMCYPIIFLVAGSFMSAGELKAQLYPMLAGDDVTKFVFIRLFPLYPTLRAYVEILLDSPQFFVMFWNSVKIVCCILVGQLFISVPAAWGLAKFKLPFKGALYLLYIVLMMMPFQVTMLSNYIILNKMNLLDTQLSVILPAIFSTFPVFIIYRFFCGVPDAIIESAKVDGATNIQIFIYIAIPLGSAGIISAMVLGFLEYWNLIEQPLTFLKTKSLWPLSLYLPNIDIENAGMAFTASIITLLPAIFVFLSGQDYLEQGIVAAAVKE